MNSLLITLLLLLLSTPLHAQKSASKKKGERTVLWEISGNGLERPSYLFGTIHIQDKRAFDFSDSVLLKFDECSIFASELMIDSAVREAFQLIAADEPVLMEGLEEEVKGIEEKLEDAIEEHGENEGEEEGDEGIVREEIVVATPSEEDPAGESRDTSVLVEPVEVESVEVESVEVEEPGLDGPVSIAVPSEEEYESGIEPSRERPTFGGSWHRNPFVADFLEEEDTLKPGDKPTMLDAYLFGLARREGKELVGLETVQEQVDATKSLNMFDFWEGALRPKKRKKGVKDGEPGELLLDYYTRGDLEEVRLFFEDNFSDRALRQILWERNHRMVERAIPYMRKGSTFIAVGTGHLPGEEGMIELFRDKGFTVRPVPATRTGLASLYRPSVRPEKWHTLSARDGAFSVDMPLEPMIFPVESSELYVFGNHAAKKIFVWPDLATGVFYVVSYIDYIDNVERWKTDVFLRLVGTGELGEEMTPIGFPKKLALDGMQGRELQAKGSDNRHHRLRIYLRGRRIYALRAISTAEMIHGVDAERFFNSFTITEYDSIRWGRFVAGDQGYTIEVPGEPEMSVDSGWGTITGTMGSLTARDSARGEYYSVHSETYGDFFTVDDEVDLYEKIFSEQVILGDSILRVIPVEHDGVAGRELFIATKPDTIPSRRMRVFLRGGRLYTIAPSVSRERLYSSDVERFFSSIDFTGEPVTNDIYADKSARLFDALVSDDDPLRRRAMRAVEHYPFRSRHLPKLYELIRDADSIAPERSDEIRTALLRRLPAIADSTTVPFIEEMYAALSESDDTRTALFHALTEIGTGEAVELLLELVFKEKDLPGGYDPFVALEQNITSVAPLYPGALLLLRRERYAGSVALLTATAIDSGMIDRGILSTHESTIIAAIRKNLPPASDAGDDEEDETEETEWNRSYMLQSLARLLGRMSASPESDSLLARMQRDDDEDVAVEAMLALARRGKGVTARIFTFVTDHERRLHIYRELESIGRLDLFPKKFATQEHIAAALMYDWLNQEEEGPDLIEPVAEREMTVKGEPMRIYLFKFAYSGSPKRWNVGYVGSQPLDRSKVDSDPLLIGASYNELSSMSIDEHIEDLIEE